MAGVTAISAARHAVERTNDFNILFPPSPKSPSYPTPIDRAAAYIDVPSEYRGRKRVNVRLTSPLYLLKLFLMISEYPRQDWESGTDVKSILAPSG
ncbi:hypothetical protein ACLBWH_07280 [Sphingomonas sp. M6A6_1c]